MITIEDVRAAHHADDPDALLKLCLLAQPCHALHIEEGAISYLADLWGKGLEDKVYTTVKSNLMLMVTTKTEMDLSYRLGGRIGAFRVGDAYLSVDNSHIYWNIASEGLRERWEQAPNYFVDHITKAIELLLHREYSRISKPLVPRRYKKIPPQIYQPRITL